MCIGGTAPYPAPDLKIPQFFVGKLYIKNAIKLDFIPPAGRAPKIDPVHMYDAWTLIRVARQISYHTGIVPAADAAAAAVRSAKLCSNPLNG
jgi:hypothetical protein